jgi:hypothetical protein
LSCARCRTADIGYERRIDAKHKSKLAKILNGPPSGYEKGLTALGKELKLGRDGKAMLAELKKDQSASQVPWLFYKK